MCQFTPSRTKVEWAKKHIAGLESLAKSFTESQLYSVSVEECTWQYGWLRNDLVITINPDASFLTEAALIIGDALHNLRGALDFLYHEVVHSCGGTPSNHTRFPTGKNREETERLIKGALKQKQITAEVGSFILDNIKPYQTGNYPLWALRELNDTDKHKLLIPTFKLMWIKHVHIRSGNEVIEYDPIFTQHSCRKRLDEGVFGRNSKVEDMGTASTALGFELSGAFAGQPVFHSLNWITEEVTRTIQAFEALAGGKPLGVSHPANCPTPAVCRG